MNDFLKRIKDKIISFESFGDNDIATGIELKTIIEDETYFSQLFSDYPLEELLTLEDYCVYLTYRKLSSSVDMVPMLAKDEYKVIVSRIANEAKLKADAIEKGDVIKFINNNIKEIFESNLEIIGIEHVTLDLIAKYRTGISEKSYQWLCEKYDYLLLNRFESFACVFEKYPTLFDGIFKTGSYQEIISLREETVYNIFLSIYKKENSKLKQTVDRVLPILVSDILELCNNANENNVMSVERSLKRFTGCLEKMKNPLVNNFASVKNRINKLLDESIKKNGHKFEYKIPTGQMLDLWKGLTSWEIKLITLTHKAEKSDKGEIVFRSNIEVDVSVVNNIMDMVSTNITKDDYYTLSLQEKLSVVGAVESATFMALIHDKELYCEFMDMVMSAIMHISKIFECDEERFDLDIKILDNHLQMCRGSAGKERITDIALCYGASMFLCALIDKLLRVLYVSLTGVDKYISLEKLTIGQILNPNDQVMKSYFGVKHIRHLSFFLSKDGLKERNIGFNYRNSLAHWTINPESVSLSLVAQLLWLFVDVMNTIFIKIIQSDLPET